MSQQSARACKTNLKTPQTDFAIRRLLTYGHKAVNIGIAVMIAVMIIKFGANIFIKPAHAQQSAGEPQSYSAIMASGIRLHYENFLRQIAQSFEAKDRNPQRFSRWPEFLPQDDAEKSLRRTAFSEDYDVRISETWEFLDYQLAYAHMRGTTDNERKQRALENLTMMRLIDQGLEIYWEGLTADRYVNDIISQQAKINKILRDSRLSNVINALLPHEEQQLLRVRNQIITTLRLFQESSQRLRQFIGHRRESAIRPLPVGVPVSYYNADQLDTDSFRLFSPFQNPDDEAQDYITVKRGYSEIERLFPSVRFDVADTVGISSRRDVVRWHNYSSQLGWNLSNVFKTYPVTRKGINREHARSSAMTLIARNRIALIEYRQSLMNFEYAMVNFNNTLWAEANASIYGTGSIENITAQVRKIVAAVNSSRAFGQLQRAYYRLLASGGYVLTDNLNPGEDERTLAGLFESDIGRLLIADAVALDTRVNETLLTEHSDNPEILRILQSWRQTLALLAASNRGTRQVRAEDTLPYLQDNVQTVQTPQKSENIGDGLLDIADALPSIKPQPKASEQAASIAIAGTTASRHRDTLSAIEKIGQAAAQTTQAATQAAAAADKAALAAQSANSAAGRAEAASHKAERSAEQFQKSAQTLEVYEQTQTQKLQQRQQSGPFFPENPANLSEQEAETFFSSP